MAKKEYSQEIIDDLRTIVDHFDKDDVAVRERQLRLWKKLDYYWAGMQRVYWDFEAHDWRTYDVNIEQGDDQAAYYDKPINVYRAHLESIIAALSAVVPGVKCYPDNAENINDVLTAKGGTKISKLIYDHINADLLWIKALFTYCTYGMVAAYNYPVKDKKYGTYEVDSYEDKEEQIQNMYCPSCGMKLEGNEFDIANALRDSESDQFRPENDANVNELEMKGVICPQCQMMINPDVRDEMIIIRRLVGKTQEPKSRQAIEILGGSYVKVPNWARNQKECPYLYYDYETHYTNVLNEWPDLYDDLNIKDTNITASASGVGSEYEIWARLAPQYLGEVPLNNPTVKKRWLRPSTFYIIPDEERRKKLFKEFKEGVKVCYVNDIFAEACPESIDDYWTLTFNPLANSVQYDPLGLLLVSVQDITNDLISLTLQTIEHGIPQTFADPQVVNFEGYKNTEATPGALFPAKAKSGKSLGDGFFTISAATLSKEVGPFSEKIDQLGQFASGDMPSLHGGSMDSSARTAAQYSMSRNQALQRLQTTWKIFNSWWKDIFGKVIPAYIKDMKDDERIVKEQGDSFINVVIKKAELEGKIGSIHLESSEELPKTWGQVRDMVMELIQLQNPEILEIMGAPENLEVLQKVFGPTGLKIPNEADREKQLEEIQYLIQGVPVEIMGPMGMPIQQSSIPVEVDVDNHRVEAEICRQWLVGEAGRQAKKDNEDGYNNVLAHMKEHQMAQMQMMQQMQPQMVPNNAPVEGVSDGNPTIN